ncbi:MAG: DUF1573 domain-containing protein [Prevotellaceae bacterium]|nr:DUF1573 domain-containing protein [Prevotellaceae bacterium]
MLLLSGLFVSCKKDKRTDDARKIVSEWTGKQIKFPDGIPCVATGSEVDCIPLSNQSYKILMYVDSVGCISCKLRLPDWNVVLAEADSLFSGKVDFLFFFQPKNERELAYLLKRDGFYHPVFFDRKNRLDRMNHFPSPMEYRCFLLDSENRVLLVGNPALNPKIWELYKQRISGEMQPEQTTVYTTVTTETPRQNLGMMKIGKIYTCTFILKNTGETPLVITDIRTVCGCTVPTWSRQPVAFGATTEVKVEVTPDTPGNFRKSVTVYGNVENTPLQLLVMGEVTVNGE